MNAPVVLGLDFGGTKIAAAVSEISGDRLGSVTIPSGAEDGAQAALERGIAAGQALLDEVAGGRQLLAVGACTFGIPGEDGVRLAPTIPGWGDVAFGRELRRAFAGAEIRLATDVKAAAHAEAEWGALVGCDPGIYLNLGTGLAVAIVVNGLVVHGYHGAAGEIGYNLRRVGDIGTNSKRAPLEEAVSGQALSQAAWLLRPPGLGAEAVFRRAHAEPAAAGVLTDFVAELSFHLVNLTIAIDPARIVVGGGMTRSWEQLRPGLRGALDTAVPYPPELVLAAFPFDAPLMGALAMSTAAAREVLQAAAPA
ncbi:MAG TPA: ROK family protein [Jatrophihabitans sp.]|nr:ROK family protein [Jatrophihabitans sp.]